MYLEIILESALFSIAFFAVTWFVKKIYDQNEEIEEILSQLQFCKKRLSRLEILKKHELKK